MPGSGRTQAEIIIADAPARMTRLAASELQTYIEKISGAKLAITNTPSGNVVKITWIRERVRLRK